MKKELGNSFWGIIDTAVYPVIYMAVVPILMHNLGAEGFGLWIIVNSLMVILQLFNLNIGITSIKELAGLKTKESVQTLNALLTIVLLMLLIVTLIGMCCGLLAENFDFSGLASAPVSSVFECLTLAGFIAGLKFFNQLFHGALKAKELIKESAFLNIFNKTGLLALTVYLAISGYDITALLYGNVFFSLLNILILMIVTAKFYPTYIPAINKDWSLMKSIFRFSVWPWFQSLFVVLAFQTDRFWVSAHAGLSVVSDYGLIATLFNHIHMIYTAMFIWVLPRIASMTVTGTNPYPFYQRIRSLFSLFVVFSLLLFYTLSPWIVPLWIGEGHYQNMKAYLQLFVVFELLFSHTIMPFFYMNATGREKTITYLTAFFCLLSYACMLIALKVSGSIVYMIGGMALSMSISMPVLNFFVRKSSVLPEKTAGFGLLEMIPYYSAAAFVLLPMPWSLLFLIPLICWVINYFPLFNQIKKDGKIYGINK